MFLQVLGIGLLVYAGVAVSIFLFQRRLMYHPDKLIGFPDAYGAETAQVIPLTTEDGIEIEAWYIAPENPEYPLILYFHGNAGHIGNRMEKIAHYAAKGFGILAVSYRGYGKSKGSPTENGLFADARTLLRYATEELNLPPERLLLYGESLGTGVATYAAKQLADDGTPAAGLVLEAPYTSVVGRSQELYPYLPAFYMVRDKYESIKRIGDIQCPLLILHGEEDKVIPARHGRTLLAAAHEPKRGLFFPGIGHTDFDAAVLADALVELAGTKEKALDA